MQLRLLLPSSDGLTSSDVHILATPVAPPIFGWMNSSSDDHVSSDTIFPFLLKRARKSKFIQHSFGCGHCRADEQESLEIDSGSSDAGLAVNQP